jgi:transcriptional regulator with XRE-family HTH domain
MPVSGIGAKVASIREALSLNRLDLQKLSNVPYSTLRELEANKRQIRPEALARIADALQVSVDFLLGRDNLDMPLEAALSVQSLRIFLKKNDRTDSTALYRLAFEARSPIRVVDWARLCDLSDRKEQLSETTMRKLSSTEPVKTTQRAG